MNTTLLLPVLAACTALAACGGMPKVDKPTDPPSRQFSSAKPVQTVADCIEKAWPTSTKVMGGGALAVERTAQAGGAQRLLLSIGGKPDHQVLVEPAGSGSKTGSWSFGMYFGDVPGQIRAVEACQ